jgi:acetylornithine deacetylase/succinyl-diaminopimelate desuccinylase-like protein
MPLRTDESLPWVAKLGELSTSHGRGFTTAPWFSDAAILGAPGRPAVCIGPGRTEDIHTKDEFIRLADLETGFQFFSEWMLTV